MPELNTIPTPAAGAPYLALEVGGTKLQLFAGTAAGEIVERCRYTVEARLGADGIRKQIAEALPGLLARWKPRAIGVGYGGPIDWRTGRVIKSHQVEGWEDFPLGDWLAGLAGVPVLVDNDANVAALGEARFGAGRGRSPVFYVTVGSGVGGGLVCEDRIYHGATPGEAEIGHLVLDAAGHRTEDFCSGWSTDRRIREAVAREPGGDLAARVKQDPGGETRHLGPAVAAGDPLAQRILDEVGQHLAFALSHVTHLFHPELIVLGGGVSLLGEPFREAVARHLGRHVMAAFQPAPGVVLASLREDAVPAGALALAHQRLTNAGATETRTL